MALLGRHPHVVRVGANTQGVFSDSRSRLPNGCGLGFRMRFYLTQDGKALGWYRRATGY